MGYVSQRLADVAPEIEVLLTRGADAPAVFTRSEIRRETVWVTMRDGVRLATDLYLSPDRPAPAVITRTPYGRANAKWPDTYIAFARCGYVVVSQDCRGTGGSEPDSWDYYVYEREDSFDLVEWVTRQAWFDGFIGACGGSYVAQTQWCMVMHPRMSAIVPVVGGLGIATRTVRKYMFYNAYARTVGKGLDKIPMSYGQLERQMVEETLAGGYFNEPLRQPFSHALLERFPHLSNLLPSQAQDWLWKYYSTAGPSQRAELIKQAVGGSNVTIMSIDALQAIFGHQIGRGHDAHAFPHTRPVDLCQSLQTPALIITGWYDWSLNDPLATWELLRREAREVVRSRSRLIITPSAHNMPGYHEGGENNPELKRTHGTANLVALLLRWYTAMREGSTDSWPTVIYYLMGANEWRIAADWPPPEAQTAALHLGPGGTLVGWSLRQTSEPDRYSYDPKDPTPTVGGSIVSYVYPPGSVDVSEVQERSDVVTYTTAPLQRPLDVVGSLRLILYASSSAVDTDFSARLSDVFPDGRAIQLQSGILRARYRNASGDAELLEPDRVYRLELDMWATANRFRIGHRLRLDISSADFPRFDRNTNLGGEPGPPVPAVQTIYHDPQHPSKLLVSIIGSRSVPV